MSLYSDLKLSNQTAVNEVLSMKRIVHGNLIGQFQS